MASDVEAGYVAATLERALDILRNDAPAAFYRLTRELEGMTLVFEIDHERFQLQSTADRIWFGPPGGTPDAAVRTDAGTILDLIDGKTALMDCILAGTLEVRAAVPILPKIARGSVAFAEGAIRSRSMRGLVASFRQARMPETASSANQSFRSIM